MIHQIKWFDRQFSLDIPIRMFPNIVERLRATPSFLQDRLASLTTEVLTCREGDKWSIQENAGHLLDLEPLWMSRVQDFIDGRETLQPADLTNKRTHEANHNSRPIETILEGFRLQRYDLVRRLEGLDEAIVMRTALHPRLKTAMRVIDMGYFVAEHDVHHMARVTELMRAQTK